MNATHASFNLRPTRLFLILAVTFAASAKLRGQVVWTGNGPDSVVATAVATAAGSAGFGFYVDGHGQAHAKSPRLPNLWGPADAYDGYLKSEASVSYDSFRVALDAQAEARSGKIPESIGNAFITPVGNAASGVYLSAHTATLRFPQLTTNNCMVEVTYRAVFSARARGVHGGTVAANASFIVIVTPPFPFVADGLTVFKQASVDDSLSHADPPSYFFDTIPKGGTNGVKTLRFRTPLQMNGAGEVFATYEVSGQIQANIVVYGPNASHNTDVSSSAHCDLYFVGKRVICSDEQGEHEVTTPVFGILPYFPALESCRTNGGTVICCRTNGGLTYCRTNEWTSNSPILVELSQPVLPTAAEMFAEPADTHVFVGERVDLGFSPALFMALSNDTPAEVQWFRSGNPAQLLSGETNASLTFVSTALSDSGAYYAVLTNDSGSVTSRVATLTVSPRPPDLRFELVAGRRVLTVGGGIGSTYRIEHTENLGPTNWNHLVDLTLGVSPFTYEDTNAPAPRRFYRAVLLP